MADIILDLAPCLRYTDGNGDTVTRIILQNYVTLLGNKVCAIITSVNSQGNAIASLGQQLSALSNKVNNIQPYTLPSLIPVGSTEPLRLDLYTAYLDQQFSAEQNALGTPDKIYSAISVQLTGLDAALGTAGSTLGNASGWINDPASYADSYSNLNIILRDIRSALRNIQLNFQSACEGISIVMQGTYISQNLRLFFTGTIPSSMMNLEPGGSMFTIKDQSGNFVQQKIDVKANLNGSAGITIDLSASPLNFADDLTVTSIYGFANPTTATVCQKSLELIVYNSTACPTLTVSEGMNSATVQFNHNLGTVTYYVELANSVNEIIQTQVRTVSGTETVVINFTGLTSGNTYKTRLRIATFNSTKICPFVIFSTLPNGCPAPNNVSATLEYE